jgi:hypothetical protein
MSYSAVRVDLHPESGGVDRTLPLPLRPLISLTDWTSFCNEVDEVNQETRNKSRIAFSIFTGGAILGFILFAIVGYLSMPSLGFSPLIAIGLPVFIGVGLAAGMVEMVHRRMAQDHRKAVQRACVDMTNRLGNVTDHYNEETALTGVMHRNAWIEFHFENVQQAPVDVEIPVFSPSAPVAIAEPIDVDIEVGAKK